jgi:trimeric autotransporter adhesin
MKNSTFRRMLFSTALFAVCFAVSSEVRATIVFKDDFNRADNTTLGSISGPGTGTWTETITPGGDSDLNVAGNLMLVDHGNTDSLYQASMSTAGFLAPWASTLAGNPGKVTWNVNMQSARPELSGFAIGSNGIGLALASTAGAFGTTNGYAVVWGQPGTTDPIALVRFTGAVSVPILAGTGTPFGDMNANFLSVRVEYEPSTNTWTMLARDDGASAFADPETGAGYVNFGSVVNSDHTSATIAQTGMFGFYTSNGATDLYRYDNYSIDVVPEPSTVALTITAVVGLAAFRVRRRKLA